ncbi:hypothetical protein PanWU01x14_329200 [Parasponia andersonii]|uniref:Uncharacterized protein n=1 Tax=Parasponia andersonii TaxID=3476 RepID=A0A2P5AIE4_PARAD|nr:hypothetical protein PanWU01x14_329200 [Parasponia andersonii]
MISSSTSSSSGKAKRISCSGAQAGLSRGRASVFGNKWGSSLDSDGVRVCLPTSRDHISTRPPPHQLPPADIRVIEAQHQRFAEQDEKQVEKGNKEVVLVWVCNSEEEEEGI